MKKVFLALSIGLLGLFFTSCVTQTQSHEHALTEVYVAPTCTTAGVRYYQCACLYTTTRETIPALGHNYVNRVCTRCGNSKLTTNLEFTLSSDQKYYIVTGMGSCVDPDVVIPNNYKLLPIKEISEEAFYNNDLLESIYIPASVTKIGKNAFSLCDNLKNVIFDKDSQVKYIEESTFASCKKLTEINLPSGLSTLGEKAFQLCEELTSIVIPDSVTSIGEQAFHLCRSLKNANLPSGIKYIKTSTFEGCTKLESIIFPTSIEKIEDRSFANCASLKKIVIPKNVKKIESYSFSNCSALKEVTFEEKGKVEIIEDYAFWQCASLTDINLPETVKVLDRGSFSGCVSLTTINIPTSVTTINEGTFYECTGLTKMIIPSSVQTMAYGVFIGCSNISIYCEAQELPSGWNPGWNPDNYQVEWSYQK